MKIDKQTLDKLAHLSRLEIKEENEATMLKDLSNIVTFIEKLNEVNTDGVEPLTTMSQEINALREDEPGGHLTHEEVLKNAPAKDKDFFRVPKVIE
jgi:aspartyl-tRNA(Asn)/glutamyl-tRNA(Gln) amidotransferase subunit C